MQQFYSRGLRSYLFILLLPILHLTFANTLKAENTDEGALTFSHQRGLYKAPFTLNISSSLSDATIAYTLDGSDPTISRTAMTSSSPASIKIDPSDDTYRGGTTPGVILRATAYNDNSVSNKIKTHSYIFINEVPTQSDPGGIWPDKQSTFAWPGYDAPQSIGYKVNTIISESSQYKDFMEEALLQIPSYSIVMDNDDMFGTESGIYMNSLNQELIKKASVEYLNPTEGEQFQANAGIKIRGRYSRLPRNPKHSMRLLFKEEYGDSKLEFPVFGKDGPNTFDRLDFRTAQNSSFHIAEDLSTITFLKEIFARDAQGQMELEHTRSHYCHLYINGMYWGLYQAQERAEKNFAEEYYGGNKLDYDVVKPQQDVPNPSNDLKIGVSDGNLDAAERLWNSMKAGFSSNTAYFKVQGKNPDGSFNPDYERLLDVENLIDYLLVSFYTGSQDGPGVTWTSLWGEMVRPNNFIGIYNRENPDGFKWIVHDMEKSMYDKNDNKYINGLGSSWYSKEFEFFNPLTIHKELLNNQEYKRVFADRVYKHFVGEGVFTPENVNAMFLERKSQIDMAVIAESARWSWWVSKYNNASKDEWESNVNSLLNNYIPYRTEIVLSLFESMGLHSSLQAPMIYEGTELILGNSETIQQGGTVHFSNPNDNTGSIYYTTDGTDPRAIGGGLSPTAILIPSLETVLINNGKKIKARVKNGEVWSALLEVNLKVNAPLANLVVTELHYHPQNTTEASKPEFIELKNTSNATMDLTNFSFVNGISYTFGSFSLAPNEFAVVTSDMALFKSAYGFDADGEYSGTLNNSGEKIELNNADGSTALSFTYNDTYPWPIAADGYGLSMVSSVSRPTGDASEASYWKASSKADGSPNADDVETEIAAIIINEVLSHPNPGEYDKIELHNPTSTSVDISYWYLSDNTKEPRKWALPSGTIVAANSYWTASEESFGSAFSISSLGEEIILSSANADGDLTGYTTAVSFKAAEEGVSFGLYSNSVGKAYFVPQMSNSFNLVNAGYKESPISLTCINYHPIDREYEFLKIRNNTEDAIDLFDSNTPTHTWKVNGIDFDFPEATSLAAYEDLYIIEQGVAAQDFRDLYGINTSKKVFNMNGKLSNSGETISLLKTAPTSTDNLLKERFYILLEAVTYSDDPPWYKQADGDGYALLRKDTKLFANDPESWEVRLAKETSIRDIKAEGYFSIYPNPTQGTVQVSTEKWSQNTNITLRDMSGRILNSQVMNSATFDLDLSDYQSGIYFITISNENYSTSNKVIKE